MGATASDRHPFLDGFAELEQRLAASDPAWLARERRAALERFVELGFPTTALEEWKQTSVSAIASSRFRPAPAGRGSIALEREPYASTRLVFVDGRLDEGLSSRSGLPRGLRVLGIAEALHQAPEEARTWLGELDPSTAGAFRALNGAFFEDGAIVAISDGLELEQPIEIVYRASGEAGVAAHVRTVVIAGANSRAAVIESYEGGGDASALTNAATQVRMAEGARLEHVRLALEGPGTFHVAAVHSHQARDSQYHARAVQLGGRLTRHELTSVLDGPGADCRLDGLVHALGEQHFDNHTLIDHAQPHGSSRELYKTILDGRSRSVFNGRIVVRRGAQRTDAKQSNPNLILSHGALAHTRPQLEIYADDVRCTHGATIGRLDEDGIFYLRTRGVPVEEAQRLLVSAFAGEVLAGVSPEPLREALERMLAVRFASAERR